MENIEVFETEIGNHYVLDGNTNMVIPIDDKLADLIRNNEELDRDLLYRNSSMSLKNMMNKWPLFMKNEGIFDYEMLKSFHYGQRSQLILNVTENCNLRCRYCIYSGENPGFRGRTNNSISYEIATKSIDRYIEYINKKPNYTTTKIPVISFYGGEPLLEFKLIKAIVNYCKKINFKPDFFMTTNATLLDKEKTKFLVTNNFALSISLDGPKDEHDRNRFFANGKGSYDAVYQNFLKFISEIIDQGKKSTLHHSVIATLDEDTDLIKTKEYFSKIITPLTRIGRISLGASTRDTCRPFVFSNFSNTMPILRALYRAKRLNNSSDDEDMSFLQMLIGVIYTRLSNRFVSPYGNAYTNTIGGACLPGTKIFVLTDGSFHLCEKINDTFPFGDYKVGFNDEKAQDVISQWSSVYLDTCRNCAFKGLCLPCQASCINVNRFEIDNYCRDVKPSWPLLLNQEYSMIENMQDPEGYYSYNTKEDDTFNFAA